MFSVPPALLDSLNLRPGDELGIEAESGRLVLERKARPRYTLRQLLAECDKRAKRSKEDREWIDSGPVGRELI